MIYFWLHEKALPVEIICSKDKVLRALTRIAQCDYVSQSVYAFCRCVDNGVAKMHVFFSSKM